MAIFRRRPPNGAGVECKRVWNTDFKVTILFNGIVIGTYTCPTQQYHFKWPWMTYSKIFSDTKRCAVSLRQVSFLFPFANHVPVLSIVLALDHLHFLDLCCICNSVKIYWNEHTHTLTQTHFRRAMLCRHAVSVHLSHSYILSKQVQKFFTIG